MSDSGSRLVYSSDDGRIRPPAASGARRSEQAGPRKSGGLPPDPDDGVVRLHRGRSSRGGKVQTLIVGLRGADAELDAILKRCKQRMATGGTRDGRVLMIQGDHREKLRALLEAEGHTVKLAGG